MAVWYRFDIDKAQLVTTAKDCKAQDFLSGRLVGIRLEDDAGIESKGIPAHKRLIVDIDKGVVVIRLFALSDPEDQRKPLDPYADRALLTLASLKCLDSCVAKIVRHKDVAFPAFCDALGQPHVPKELRGQTPQQTLAMTSRIVRAVLLGEQV